MKVEIERNAITSDVKYPCLMENRRGTVVLFTEESTGTVVYASAISEYQNNIGHTSSIWNDIQFHEFCGNLTISN